MKIIIELTEEIDLADQSTRDLFRELETVCVNRGVAVRSVAGGTCLSLYEKRKLQKCQRQLIMLQQAYDQHLRGSSIKAFMVNVAKILDKPKKPDASKKATILKGRT